VFHCGGGRDRAGQIAVLVLAIAGVSPQVIAGDYALSLDRLPARYAARQEPDQGPLLQHYLARQGTTAEAIIMELLASIDVPRAMRDAGLSDQQIDRLRGRLLDASLQC
jgi:protein-tyrosine phosphatase